MDCQAILKVAHNNGVTVSLEGGRLKYSGSRHGIKKILPLLRQHRDVLAKYLQEHTNQEGPEQPAELPLRADTTCLACKHYQPDWQNPVRRQNRLPITKGKCELTGLEVLETRTCDRFEPLFRFREPQPEADNSYVRIHKILSLSPTGKLISWPEADVKLVEEGANNHGGLPVVIEAIRAHKGAVAYLVSCRALGNKTWLVHERNKINNITGERYVVKLHASEE